MKKYMVSGYPARRLCFWGVCDRTDEADDRGHREGYDLVLLADVLAGARKAGQDFGANVVELGAQSESDAIGQIGILEKAVASNPAAIVIAPAQFAALGKPIDEAAKKAKVIGIELGRRHQCHDFAAWPPTM